MVIETTETPNNTTRYVIAVKRYVKFIAIFPYKVSRDKNALKYEIQLYTNFILIPVHAIRTYVKNKLINIIVNDNLDIGLISYRHLYTL